MTVSEFLEKLADDLVALGAVRPDLGSKFNRWAGKCRDYATISMNEYQLAPEPVPAIAAAVAPKPKRKRAP